MEDKKTRWTGAWAIWLAVFVCSALHLWALDPERKLSQYVRKTWEIGSAFPNASIASIAQGPNGYLWIGTDKGLVRFDGLEFQTRSLLGGEDPAPPLAVKQLVADNESNVWVLLADTSLLRIRNGGLEKIRDQAEQGVTALYGKPERSTLFSSLMYGPMQYEAGHFRTLFPNVKSSPLGSASSFGEVSSLTVWSSGAASHRLVEPGVPISAAAALADGTIWLGTSNDGLFRFARGGVTHVWASKTTIHITSLLPSTDGALWIGTNQGLHFWDGKKISQTGLHPDLLHVDVRSMVADHDSNLWLGTKQGLIRVTRAGAGVEHDVSQRQRPITTVFVDRAGELWAGGPGGLERLRDSVFASFPSIRTASDGVGPLYAGDKQRIWFAPLSRGLNSMNTDDGLEKSVPALSNDLVYSLAGVDKEIWAGTKDSGLIQMTGGPQPQVRKRYTTRDGLPENGVYTVHVCSDGSVWLGTLGSGASHLLHGHFDNYIVGGGQESVHVNAIAETPDHAIWFATRTGLSQWKGGKWRNYNARDGLPNENVTSLFVDRRGTLWVGTLAGLTFIRDGKLQASPSGSPLFREAIFMIAEDETGRIWLTTSDRVASFSPERNPGDAGRVTEMREYTTDDGLPSLLSVNRSRSIDMDPSGRVWFATNKGLAVVNPQHEMRTDVASVAKVETVDIDNMPIDFNGKWQVPPGQHRVSFTYSSVNLANPASIRFRYRLTGFDSDWSAPISARTAVYTNLGAGTYTFHVASGTESGGWNGETAPILFSVEQVWYRTLLFESACALAGLLTIWWIYRLRVGQIAATINARFEERLAERTRIARELHDTLLQTLQGSKLVADDALDSELAPEKLRAVVRQLSSWLGRASEESRAAVNSMRSPEIRNDDLESAFRRALAADHFTTDQETSLTVTGDSMDISTALRDEICLIGLEAIRNARKHSKGTRLRVEVECKRKLVLRVEDNGLGISPELLNEGRLGHFGLKGMRERAKRIGGSLVFRSIPNEGTTITLLVPRHALILERGRKRVDRWFGWFLRLFQSRSVR